ncbi:GNAT family N-acetyltransferase (plasmid) [Bradyrhizobium sp. PMVTL-01]|uniref:GNAT family N-acetyltransferase n=1 Tax=Bradyrhizobium sp. PMVTL-01 TaxID=3434999 RepID=UPI003F705D21
MSYQLIQLREKPQHLKTVAGWIHQQWWSNTNTPTDAIERWLGTHLGTDGFPTTLVAIEADDVIGSVSLHETEAEDRQAYKPYLGALYVKPANRGRGVGATLVQAAEAHGRGLGFSEIYLNAADPLVVFYEALSWKVVERDYGPKHLNIMRRRLKTSGGC